MKTPKQIRDAIRRMEKNHELFGKTNESIVMIKTLYWVLEESPETSLEVVQ